MRPDPLVANRPALLKDLLIMLAGSVSSRTSFNKIAKVLGITVDTVKEYVGYLEEAFLVKPLEKWSTSYADKVYSQKKIYMYDTGVKTALTGKADKGAKVENAVYLRLLKAHENIGYYAESEKELDFACVPFGSPSAIEVKYDSRFDWEDKRFTGVRLFVKRCPKAKNITIVTKDTSERFKYGKLPVSVVPAWEFLMG